MTSKNLILGAGLSGKIFGFYNREYKIIGTENDFASNSISKNSLFLHDNNINRRFLQDLTEISKTEIPFAYKNLEILTFKDNSYSDITSDEDRLKIINKKLTALDGTKLNFKESVFSNGLKLSEEHNNILKVIDTDFADINKALNKVIAEQIINKNYITKIDTKNKIIYLNQTNYNYNDCVSTLPLNVFLKLAGRLVNQENFKSLDMTIAEGDEALFDVPRIPYEDAIVYFPEDKFEFGRIVKRKNKCYCEITGTTDKYKNFAVQKAARIVTNRNTETFPNIMYLGRFAQWNSDIKLEDVIRKSSDKISLSNLWNDQRQFSSRFYNFSEDLLLIQRNIKDMSMLTMNEMFDLLNLLNWKSHCPEKKIDLNKVKEEWIDSMKYLISIGINLGISHEDFIDEYAKKSRKLEEKYGGAK